MPHPGGPRCSWPHVDATPALADSAGLKRRHPQRDSHIRTTLECTYRTVGQVRRPLGHGSHPFAQHYSHTIVCSHGRTLFARAHTIRTLFARSHTTCIRTVAHYLHTIRTLFARFTHYSRQRHTKFAHYSHKFAPGHTILAVGVSPFAAFALITQYSHSSHPFAFVNVRYVHAL